MACTICGGFVLSGGNICARCAATRNPRNPQALNVHQIGRGINYQGPQAAVPLVWQTASQARGTIQAGNGGLGPYMAGWMPHMVTWLTNGGRWGAAAATHFGDQHTPGNCTHGTLSLDFQGIRAGGNNTFWIDLQAQMGGGPTVRNTYGQVLIQCAGAAPPTATLVAAIQDSLGGARRSLVHTGAGAAGAPP